MQQIYGPYRLTDGQHEEDVPSGVAFKVEKLEPSFVVVDGGIKLPIDRGAYLLHGGTSHSIWRGNRRIGITELSPGDEIELCHGVIYGPPHTPQKHRRPDVIYSDAFMSSQELDVKFNRPNSMKFIKATDVSQGNEIAELRKQVAELRERLAAQASQPASQLSATEAGRVAEDNAAKRQAGDNRNQPSQKRQPQPA